MKIDTKKAKIEKAKIGYYNGDGNSHGISIEYDGRGYRLTTGKIWGYYQPIAEFSLSKNDIADTIRELQGIYSRMEATEVN